MNPEGPSTDRLVSDGVWLLQQLGIGLLGIGGLMVLVFAAYVVDQVMYPPRPRKGKDDE